MMNTVTRRVTPLRYPGGKAQLGAYFAAVVEKNKLTDGVYVEPFAGGAGVAMMLLLNEYVDSVCINDVDIAVYSFWKSVTEATSTFCELIARTPLTIAEWERQRDIFRLGAAIDTLSLGFATFYLNRTNRSGIMNGGVIGGKNQDGPWKLDARFNRNELASRVKRIGRYRTRIAVTNEDAVPLLRRLAHDLPRRALLYLDPPYYEKGQHLYTNYYRHEDHAVIAQILREIGRPWIVTYDDHPAIRDLYGDFRHFEYSLSYAARERRKGSEVMFFSPDLQAEAVM